MTQHGFVSRVEQRLADRLRAYGLPACLLGRPVRFAAAAVPAEELPTAKEVVQAGIACRPLMARTLFGNARYDCVLEYPIKTINLNDRHGIFQPDTGYFVTLVFFLVCVLFFGGVFGVRVRLGVPLFPSAASGRATKWCAGRARSHPGRPSCRRGCRCRRRCLLWPKICFQAASFPGPGRRARKHVR